MSTLAERLIGEITRWHPDVKWMDTARKLGGRKVHDSRGWVGFEFPSTRKAEAAANAAADLGLQNNWNDETVEIKTKSSTLGTGPR